MGAQPTGDRGRAPSPGGSPGRLIFVNSSTAEQNVTFDEPINAATDAFIEPGQSGDIPPGSRVLYAHTPGLGS